MKEKTTHFGEGRPVQQRERPFGEEVEEIRREYRRFVNDPAPSTFPHPSWSDVGILLAALRADPPVEQRERLKKEIGGECCCHYDDLED